MRRVANPNAINHKRGGKYSMKILVLGGTGFIGPHAVRLLMAGGNEVAVFHRGQTRGRMPDGTRWIQGNYQRIAEHTAELQSFSPEVVVDMIPITEQNAHDVLAVFRGVARCPPIRF
jgi:nucleoside-diphosphate-sugar epimerase